MDQHQMNYSMKALCEAMAVSRSGFYRWKRFGCQEGMRDQKVAQAFHGQKGRCGAPSLTQELNANGLDVSERTVGRSLHRQKLRVRYARKFCRTTDSNHTYAISPNLLERQFSVDCPNQVWVGDITYLRTTEGWLYLAVMMDLFSRQIVGWQISTRIDQQLVNDALQSALANRGFPARVMIHTDRGSQYCSHSFRAIIKKYKLNQSMSRKGNCWDNAVAESFFASLKKQAIHGEPLGNHHQTRQRIFEYIELYYNRVRRHSANGWMSPVNFERLHSQP